MRHLRQLCSLAVVMGALVMTALAAPPPRAPELLPHPEAKFVPRFEAVAETKLLMEGLANPNYRALVKHLEGKGPQDGDTWMFARGQSLLLAETGNLLLLRPPRNEGRDRWMRRATDMRESATNLGRRLANRDLGRSRSALADLTTKCNSCHQAFRVPTRIGPNAEPVPPEVKDGRRDTE